MRRSGSEARPGFRAGPVFRFVISVVFLLGTLNGEAASAAESADCRLLERVVIKEQQILSGTERARLTDGFIGRCIDAGLLREMLTEVSALYLELGYVTTRPYLAEQDIGDGVVEIDVVPGTIEKIVEARTGEASLRLDTAFLSVGEILNLRELETALETLQSVASVSASFELRPGSRAGATIVAVEIEERRPLRFTFGINAQTGLDEQFSLHAAVDNPLQLNDALDLRYNNGEVRDNRQSDRSSEIAYRFALGAYRIQIARSNIDFEQRVQGINESFLSTGDTETDRLRVERNLYRSQRHRLGLGLALELKDSNSFFEGERIDVSSYRTTQAQLDLQHLWLTDWGSLNSRFALHEGLDSYGARDDDYYTLEDGFENAARLQFTKFVLDSNLEVLLGRSPWRLITRLYWQATDDILFAADQLSLGSPYSVRGYPAALSGSNAWYLRNDLRRRLPSRRAQARGPALAKLLEFSLGLDYGDVDCERDNPDVCGEIYALALGLDLTDDNFSGRFVWGHPLREVDAGIGDEDQFFLELRWML